MTHSIDSDPGLFAESQPAVRKSAMLSEDPGQARAVYRYSLTRDWSDPSRFVRQFVTFVMLNPSTADHRIDDPTIKACIRLARIWGFDGIRVVNLYAYRSSKPDVMFAAERVDGRDIVGPDNDRAIGKALLQAYNTCAPVIVAWGNNGAAGREGWLIREAERLGVQLQCLGTTQSGAPKHPLARGRHRIPDDVKPTPWTRVTPPVHRCTCSPAEVENGVCVLCGKPFLVGGSV